MPLRKFAVGSFETDGHNILRTRRNDRHLYFFRVGYRLGQFSIKCGRHFWGKVDKHTFLHNLNMLNPKKLFTKLDSDI